MPELPEVETVRLTLAPLVGRRFAGVWSSGKALRLGHPIDVRALRAATRQRVVTGVRRLGKFLLIDTDGRKSVLVHLGMSGRLRLIARAAPREAHTHVVFRLDPGAATELRYSDPRRFGQVEVVTRGLEREHPSLAKLGLDPLVDAISGDFLHQHFRGARRSIKSALLDQRVIAGIGNIYASEALHRAGIRPSLAAGKLSGPRCEALAVAAREVLEWALARGGTSLRDFVDAHGSTGDNSHYLRVYDRAGQPCPRRGCKGHIRRTIIQGRSTFHCPSCQTR